LCLNKNITSIYTHTYINYEVCDCDWNTIFRNELSEVKKRFEWYKDGIENGDIYLECECEEQSQNIMKEQMPKKVLNSKKK
jgi:elongation factor P--beta-lysine ligase